MAGNPYVPQGTLNRIRASLVVTNFPSLNLTSSNLAKAGISVTFQGNTTDLIGTLTGLVPSPEPYIVAELTIAMLKTQGLSDLYKQQWESNSVVGNVIVKPDSATLGNFSLDNCAIQSVREMSFAGTDPAMVVIIQGAYYVNNSLWATI